MLVFYKERLVILSVPKTGTTALQTALRDRADIVVSDPPDLKHAPLYRYDRFFRPIFQKVCNAEMEIVAVMREPVSWLGSWYRYRRRPFMTGNPHATFDVSFDDFVRAYLRGKRPGFADVGSQAKFLEPRPNGTSVTHLFRYETPETLVEFLSRRLGEIPMLKQENVSPKMDLKLSEHTAQKYHRKCPEEFRLYNSIS